MLIKIAYLEFFFCFCFAVMKNKINGKINPGYIVIEAFSEIRAYNQKSRFEKNENENGICLLQKVLHLK